MLETAIQTLLTWNSPITLASGVQVQAGRAREGWRAPYIVYHLFGWDRTDAHDGPLELHFKDFQISVFANTYAEAAAEAELVRQILDGFKGTVGAVRITACQFQDGRIIPEDDTNLFHASLDFKVQFYV